MYLRFACRMRITNKIISNVIKVTLYNYDLFNNLYLIVDDEQDNILKKNLKLFAENTIPTTVDCNNANLYDNIVVHQRYAMSHLFGFNLKTILFPSVASLAHSVNHLSFKFYRK